MKKLLILTILIPCLAKSQSIDSISTILRSLQSQIDAIKKDSQLLSKRFYIDNNVIDLASYNPSFTATSDTSAQYIKITDKGSTARIYGLLMSSNNRLKYAVDQYGTVYTDRIDEPSGSTGNKTHWTTAGSVNIAKGTNSVTVTNSLFWDGCHIVPVIETKDSYLKNVVVTYNYALNQFTIIGNANAGAECRVAYTITRKL